MTPRGLHPTSHTRVYINQLSRKGIDRSVLKIFRNFDFLLREQNQEKMMMSNFSRNSNFQRGGALRRSQHNHFVENSGQWVANIYVNGLAANQMEVFVDRGDVVVRSKECAQKYYE